MAKNVMWGKNTEKTKRPKKRQNVMRGKTALVQTHPQMCREAGGRVATNVLIRDLDLGEFNAFDNLQVEVIADGLTLWQGEQLATDTTLVSPLQGDGSARPRAADHNGAALEAARRRNSPRV